MRTIVPTAILDQLWRQLGDLPSKASRERTAVFAAFRAFGSARTLQRRLQLRFGRQRAERDDAGQSTPAAEHAGQLVGDLKRKAFHLSGRWMSTESAIQQLRDEGRLGDLQVSLSAVNRAIQVKEVLQTRRSYEVVGSPHVGFKHYADSSGSAVFRCVDFTASEPVVETTHALDSSAAKNHPETLSGRRQLYLIAVVDAYSGYVHAAYHAMPAVNSWAVASFLLRAWRTMGVPQWLLTDNGAEFKGAVDPLLTSLDVGRVKSRARTPWARGQIERVFRTVFSSFEVPLLMRVGVGARMSLEELNAKLAAWLAVGYNDRPARISTSGSGSRYDALGHNQSYGAWPSRPYFAKYVSRMRLTTGVQAWPPKVPLLMKQAKATVGLSAGA